MSEYIVELDAHNASAALSLCDGVHEEIVRCRDCQRFYTNTNGFDCQKLDPDGFCAWGKKKQLTSGYKTINMVNK